MHGKKRVRGRISGYGIQLREKQKAKRSYGILESQFHHYYEIARKSAKNTGEVLMQLLESRLDNQVYRLGFTQSRSLARQLVTHGNVLVDGKRVDVPSFQTKPGMVISLPDNAAKFDFVSVDCAVLFDFDPQFGIRQAHAVADGRAKHFGVGLT
jgi:small subunit ribosomal protein S4